MFSRVSAGVMLLLLVCLVSLSLSCRRGPARVYPPSINASKAGALAIEMFDTNNDGKISGKELDKCPGLKAATMRPAMGGPATVDPDGTGVTADMITARIKAWQASKLGRMSLRCMVTYNGQPLEAADVKFVPEPFIDQATSPRPPGFPTATGRTDANGVAMLSIPTTDNGPPGVPPGFYRVEITKPARAPQAGPAGPPRENGQPDDPGEPAEPGNAALKIPAKYNTETILGQEVAIDAEGVRSGIKFDLVF